DKADGVLKELRRILEPVTTTVEPDVAGAAVGQVGWPAPPQFGVAGAVCADTNVGAAIAIAKTEAPINDLLIDLPNWFFKILS
ncbi:MAG: hypothetical protein AAB680_04025, partial [Pseudomonadota bacterium]